MPEISRHSHTLQACSDYNKKAWLDAFGLAKSQSLQQPPRHNQQAQFTNSILSPVAEQPHSIVTLSHTNQ